MYAPEKWVPRAKTVDVFKIELDKLEDLKNLLGASSVRTAYNRGGTILIEWTMMHRETFAGLVGQYIVRNDRGEFRVLDAEDLLVDYEPDVANPVFPIDDEDYKLDAKLLVANYESGPVPTELLYEFAEIGPALYKLESEIKNTSPVTDSTKAKNPTAKKEDHDR